MHLSKIDITLIRTRFSPEEAIEGTITLRLEKPIQSRGVFVELTSRERHTPRGVVLMDGQRPQKLAYGTKSDSTT
jgi:hypothetical protein